MSQLHSAYNDAVVKRGTHHVPGRLLSRDPRDGGDYWRGVLVLPKMPFACQNPMGGEGGIMTGGVNVVVVAGVYCGRLV